MKDTPLLTVVINTFNEEQIIAECIASARKLSQSIVVIDTESTDNTVSIVQKLGIPTFSFPFSRYVEPSRAFGISKAPGDWVFILDADERITNDLAQEVTDTITQTPHTHFKVPRRNMFGKNTWLQHGGWWPDQQLRLIKKSSFKEWPKEIHSFPIIDGTKSTLSSYMLHFVQGDLASMVNKTMIYEDIEAQQLSKAGRNVSLSIVFRKYAGELYRRMIRKTAWKDGAAGIIAALYQAYSKTITYLFLYEKYQESTHH